MHRFYTVARPIGLTTFADCNRSVPDVLNSISSTVLAERSHSIESFAGSRLTQQIILQVCELIREQRLVPGDRIPAERVLAEQLQVSRPSLREALTALESAGVVETRHGGGTFVRDFSEVGVTSPLAIAMATTNDIVGDLLDVRIIFEPIVTAQAALRATPAEIAAMQHNLAEQRLLVDARDGSAGLLILDRQFHTHIAKASRNRVSLRVLQLFNELLHDVRRHFVAEPWRRQRTWEQHARIVAAIEAHDPHAARDAMLAHLIEVEQEVERYLSGALQPLDSSPTPDSTTTYDERVYSMHKPATTTARARQRSTVAARIGDSEQDHA